LVRPLNISLDGWQAWSPREAADRLSGVSAPWYVAAGWALDLFLGRQTREHDDLEIGVPAHRFPEIRAALRDYELFVVGDGQAWPLTESTLAAHRQTWVREADGPWRLDVFREPWEDDVWAFRHDARIHLTEATLVAHTHDGIPFLQPEVVLLFKARAAARPKDESDFATVLPHLGGSRRQWLRDALALVHPGHPWLETLATD
jgi:Aminoglycoside-2''-adenylyltransferase